MIENYLKSFQILSDDEIENFIKIASKKQIKKGDYFIQEGETSKEVAFVESGILRTYYTSNKGVEITYCILFPNNLITAYSSYITGTKTIENIQAITNVELLVVAKNKIDELVENNPNWVKFLKIMAEQQYIELEKRIFQFQQVTALQRYENLLKNQPQYVQFIPLQYLASYLGITQRHLSRIRKEISF